MSKSTEPAEITVGVSLQGLTWASLRRFVEMCEDIPDGELVGLVASEYDYTTTGLEGCITLPAVTDG